MPQIDPLLRRLGLFAAAWLLLPTVRAGEIVGIPVPVPPDIPRRAAISLSNDFLARGSYLDDYRTQQLTLEWHLGDRWVASLDHSILTLEEDTTGDNPPGRLDQFGGTLGFRLIEHESSRSNWALTAGAGFRSTGDFAGQDVQNGFHSLIRDRIVRLPYVGSERTDATAWLRFNGAGRFGEPVEHQWQFGYWLHATSLVTTDGQSDHVIGGHLTWQRSAFKTWLGVRGDWRNGYDRDFVQRLVAENEEAAYLVFGLRWGPVIFDTAQGFESDKAFGRVSLLADFNPAAAGKNTKRRMSIGGGVSVTEVYAILQGRAEACDWLQCSADGRWNTVLQMLHGRPPIGDATDRFVDTWQLGVGLEREQEFSWLPRWMTFYAWGGAGWRREEAFGEGDLNGVESRAVDNFVGIGEVGVRATTAAAGAHWSLHLQAGVQGWLPAGSDSVEFAGGTEKLQEAGAALLLAAVLQFRP